jgi:ribosomal protein S18 acetylase RimI-like enzyme
MNIRLQYLLQSQVNQSVVDDLHSLAQQISPHAKPVTVTTVFNLLNHGNNLVVASDNGKVIGMCSLLMQFRVTGTIARIEHLAVDTEYRRKGIATNMMTLLMESAKSLGAVRIDLGTGDESAEALYRKLGFEHNDHEKVYWFTP